MYDIIIVGGSLSGTVAAINAVKKGAKVTWVASTAEYEFRHGFWAFLVNLFEAMKDGYRNFPGFFKNQNQGLAGNRLFV